MASRRVRLATRGSTLARRQSDIVAAMLTREHPDVEVSLVPVTTRGDRDQRSFGEIGGKGLFMSEVERTVLEGEADAAVHSAKDLTAELGPGCTIVCVPERAAPHDVVIGGTGTTGEERLGSLPPGATVGSSSMRRRALLAEARPDVEAVEFRGNLDTRLRKVAEGEADAAILAGAGIARLGRDEDGVLDPTWWVPAPGQGSLAVECLADRDDLVELFAALEDGDARAELTCERAFGARLEGGCSVPLGCLARADRGRLVVIGYLGDPEGGHALRDRISGGVDEAAELGRELADAILSSGGDELLASVRELEAPRQGGP